MKSQLHLLAGLYSHIPLDIREQYPSMRGEIELHLSRLPQQLAGRGCEFFTITLPECAAWFHQALDLGHLPEGRRPPYHGAKTNRDQRPKFLWGIWCELFDEHGTLRDVHDPAPIILLRQIYLFAKKFEMKCTKDRVDETVKAFIDVEAELPRSHPDTWDSDLPVWRDRNGHPIWGTVRPSLITLLEVASPESPIEWQPFRLLCRRFAASLGIFDVWTIRPKHGPGVVSDGAEVKYDFPNWPRKLDRVFPSDFFASHCFSVGERSDKEFPSRLARVPKTQKGPRLIASEPTAHQWIQGGIQRWLEDAVYRSPLSASIDFRRQDLSQAMALEASVDGALATVDLSAASDRLSTRLVEYVFQSNHSLLDALHASRSRSLLIPKVLHPEGHSELLLLRKFAPMGSACTFPVQTIVFALIAQFAIMITDHDFEVDALSIRRRSSQIRVFGDDIIIPTRAYPILERLLKSLLLRVNVSKSFANGLFRESCGMDAYGGFDVTPAYLRKEYSTRNPESLASIIEVSNNFHKKLLWHSSDFLLKTVPQSDLSRLAVVGLRERAVTEQVADHSSRGNWLSGPCFILSFSRGLSARKRFNHFLQREEFLTLDVFSNVERLEGSGDASLLQYFTESPDPDLMIGWSHGQAMRPVLRKKNRWVSTY